MSTDVQEPATTDAQAPQRNVAIKSIKLTNLLSFGPDSEPLELGPLNVLIGANGSGKSNFIEVLALLGSIPDGRMQDYVTESGGENQWRWKGASDSPSAVELTVLHDAWMHGTYKMYETHKWIHYSLTLNLDDFFGATVSTEAVLSDVQGVEDRPFFYYVNDGEVKRLHSKNKSAAEQKDGSTNISSFSSILAQLNNYASYPEITALSRTFKGFKIYRDWSFSHTSPVRAPQRTTKPATLLNEDASNLVTVLNALSNNRKIEDKLNKYIEDFYAGAKGVGIEVLSDYIQLVLKEDDFVTPASRLSDGTLKWLALLAVLLNSEPPPLICLEEPELGLHPDIIPTLAKLLREASERSQLIVTTHSRDLVDAFTSTPDVVVVCEKEAGATKMRRLPNRDELTAWLDKFSLGEMWSMNLLGGNRY
ncbi:MAG: chromosome segregation protein SMC [Candidatus Chloroheliales bacterium]|nr:MAG: chromosome segregation protein SMC [Chloroflexota bacterium]